MHPRELRNSPAYRWGASTLFLATGVILVALGFEHIGGYAPCPLCLQQRWAYYAGIPLTFLGLVLLSAEYPRAAGLLLLAVGLLYLANAGLGAYHAGIEWKLWPGPDSCAAGGQVAANVGDLLKGLTNPRVVRCDEATWQFLGLSFAGWNVVTSLTLFVSALKAAFCSAEHEIYI